MADGQNICGDPTCESDACTSEAIDRWFDRQWANARTAVRGMYGLPDDGLDGDAPIFTRPLPEEIPNG